MWHVEKVKDSAGSFKVQWKSDLQVTPWLHNTHLLFTLENCVCVCTCVCIGLFHSVQNTRLMPTHTYTNIHTRTPQGGRHPAPVSEHPPREWIFYLSVWLTPSPPSQRLCHWCGKQNNRHPAGKGLSKLLHLILSTVCRLFNSTVTWWFPTIVHWSLSLIAVHNVHCYLRNCFLFISLHWTWGRQFVVQRCLFPPPHP